MFPHVKYAVYPIFLWSIFYCQPVAMKYQWAKLKCMVNMKMHTDSPIVWTKNVKYISNNLYIFLKFHSCIWKSYRVRVEGWRDRETEREPSSISWFIFQMMVMVEAGPAEARSWRFRVDLPCGWQWPKTWAIFCSFSQANNSEVRLEVE